MKWEKTDFTTDEFRILTNSASNYTMKRYHFHDSYEIYYLVSGSRDYFISDHIYHVNRGNLVLIRPHDLHKTIETGESHSRVLIGFSPSFFPVKENREITDRCFSESRILALDTGSRGEIETRLESMIAASKRDSPFRLSRLQCEFASFLIETADIIGGTERGKEKRKTVNDTVKRMLPYLKANYTRQMTLDELSREFYVSRYHITRIFKGETGFTIFEYIHSLRIQVKVYGSQQMLIHLQDKPKQVISSNKDLAITSWEYHESNNTLVVDMEAHDFQGEKAIIEIQK